MVQKVTVAAAVAAFASVTEAWLPDHKLRGVNVGTMFVYEPWIDSEEWSRIGCSGEQRSEFDCVLHLGQDNANTAFQRHYNEWIGDTDLDEMASYGLNTIRVPLGYWINDALVDSSESFPRGGLDRLTSFVGAAADRGFYIIIEYAPCAQLLISYVLGADSMTASTAALVPKSPTSPSLARTTPTPTSTTTTTTAEPSSGFDG